MAEKIDLDTEENDVADSTLKRINSEKGVKTDAAEFTQSRSLNNSFVSKLTNLQIPSNDDLVERLKNESESDLVLESLPPESPEDGYETAEESSASEKPRPNLRIKELDATKEAAVSEESILKRSSPHSGMKQLQLGKKLSCKWSTGAGPRIGCLRDYPSELQSQALEQANLSPRSGGSILHKISHSRPQASPLSKRSSVKFSC